MKLQEKIYQHRKQLGLSQEELAGQLGVTRQAVSKWELGTSQPELDMVVRLAELFGVTCDSLLTDVPAEKEKDWVDRLTGMLGKLTRRYSWLAGVYLALLGLGLMLMGWFAGAATQSLTDFAGSSGVLDAYAYREHMSASGMLEMSSGPFDFFGSVSLVLLILGGVLVVAGILLAVLLKRRSK